MGEPLTGQGYGIRSVAFSPDGKKIVSGGYDVRLWDVEMRQLVGHPMRKDDLWVESVIFSPDGKQIVSGGTDIDLLDVETGQHTVEMNNDDFVYGISFDPTNAKQFVSGGHTISLWNIEIGQLIEETFVEYTELITSIVFSPDGKEIISGGHDQPVRRWNAKTGELIEELFLDDTARIQSIVFSPDGTILAIGDDDYLRLVDARTGQMIGNKLVGQDAWALSISPSGLLNSGHSYLVNSLDFSPDGKILASGSGDKTIRLWDMDIESWQAKACQRAGRNLTLQEWNTYYSENVPYEITCPQWDIPDDAQAYLDARALRQKQILAGVMGILSILGIVLLISRIKKKEKK